MTASLIGVMGCLPRLPSDFPLDHRENSGNMIHARAPFEMFPNCVFIRDDVKRYGEKRFIDLVNNQCSHLVITLANTLRLGDTDGTKYTRQLQFMTQVKRPIVIFGLGVQGMTYDLESATLPPEAIELLKFYGDHCAAVAVRGAYTKAVIEKLAGLKNVMVVGCPSLFSRPAGLAELRQREREGKREGRPSYAGTHFTNPLELQMLGHALRSDTFLVEPVNSNHHAYHLHVSRGGSPDKHLPPSMRDLAKMQPDLGEPQSIGRYFRANYRLFRSTEEWYQYNQEMVSFTYGTRFHVNMASIISGRPAMWVLHDARTRELAEQLHLPAIELEQAADLPPEVIRSRLDMTEFFDHLDGHFRNFNDYLVVNGLPAIKYNF